MFLPGGDGTENFASLVVAWLHELQTVNHAWNPSLKQSLERFEVFFEPPKAHAAVPGACDGETYCALATIAKGDMIGCETHQKQRRLNRATMPKQ